MTRDPTVRSVLATLACAALPALDASATVYRCVEAGRVTYADRPCGDAVAMVGAQPGEASATRDGRRMVSVAVLDVQRGVVLASRSDVPDAAAGGVMAGMSPQNVYAAWGRPSQMAMKLERGVLIERWIYRAAQQTTRIEFRLGRVTDVTSQ
jgi:hypothetical protein